MKFIDVNPEDIDNIRRGRRGRVSYPILKSFLETGKFIVQLDTTGIQQSMQALTSSLNTYIRNHDLPIKLFQRTGNVYLMRLDIDENGVAISNWKEELETADQSEADEPILVINDATIANQFKTESKKTTK